MPYQLGHNWDRRKIKHGKEIRRLSQMSQLTQLFLTLAPRAINVIALFGFLKE
jgi:hypothetical protein